MISSVSNYDLRWEWFPRPGDVLAASLFYKAITDPIEYISFGATNRTFIQPVNYGFGQVRGIELEFRAALDRVWGPPKYLAFGVNGTYLKSEVEVPASGAEVAPRTSGWTRRTRPCRVSRSTS